MKQGFTLVELLVIVTILGVLSTLGFIYMGGYASSARNAVRVGDIGSIRNIVENETTQGVGLMAFTKGGQELSVASLGGTGALVGDEYKAGEIIPSVLNIVSPDFEDPYGDVYKIGVTTKNKGKYELGSILESDDGEVAKVVGVYTPRVLETISATGELGSKKVLLSFPKDSSKFYGGDFLSGAGVQPGTTIRAIAADGLHLVLNKSLTSNISSIQLAASETQGLIKGVSSANPVVDGTDVLPY